MKRLRPVALLVTMALAGPAFGACGDGNTSTGDGVPARDDLIGPIVATGAGLPIVATPAGITAALVTNDGEPIEIAVPAGAVPDEVELTVDVVTAPEFVGTRIVAATPALFDIVADDALNWAATDDTTVAPLDAVMYAVDAMHPVAPTLRLGPSGTVFEVPVDITVTIDEESRGTGTSVVPLLIDDEGRVEIAPIVARADDGGTVTVAVTHFSLLVVVGVGGALVSLAIAGPRLLRNTPSLALYALDRGPIAAAARDLPTREELASELFSAALCSNTVIRAWAEPATERPSLYQTLQWLAFKNGEDAIERPAVGAALQSFLTQRAADVRNGVAQPASPGEVFEVAVDAADGDVFDALIQTHNLLRDESDAQRFGRSRYREALARIRPVGQDDEGAWYHLFGTAAYSYLSREARTRLGSGGDASSQAMTDGALVATIEEMFFASEGGDITGDPGEYVIDLRGVTLGVDLFERLALATPEQLAQARLDNAGNCTGSWTTTWGSPSSPEAQQYLVSTSNVMVTTEGPVTYWHPVVGGGTEQDAPVGTLVYHIPIPGPIAGGELRMTIATFHWDYSMGSAAIDGSIDGANWQLLTEIGPPAFGDGTGGGLGGPIPALFVGSQDVWLRVRLVAWGPQAGDGAPWTNTAQHARWDTGTGSDTFQLRVDLTP